MAPTVLIVEDEPLIRLVTAEILRDEGYEVVEAANADEALAILDTRGPVDLVFSDIRMPGSMDGCALARHVAASWPAVRIVLTSGYDAELYAAPSRCAFPVVAKPYRPNAVLATIRAAIAGISDDRKAAGGET